MLTLVASVHGVAARTSRARRRDLRRQSPLGILGLAYVVGVATERLGALTGPQVGGILNATFGNIAELIIAFFALHGRAASRSSRRR